MEVKEVGSPTLSGAVDGNKGGNENVSSKRLGILARIRSRFGGGKEKETDGLRGALDRRLAGWQLKVVEALVKAESVEKPETLKEQLKNMRDAITNPDLVPDFAHQLEQHRREFWDSVEPSLRSANLWLISLRLRLGGPYPQKETK